MTPERYERLCRLFDQAQSRPPDQRTAFLQEVGAADPTLRDDLEKLLADDRAARGEQFLQAPCPVNARDLLRPGDRPTLPGAPPADEADDGLIGRRLGPYLVEQRVGSGGMGSVYRALREGDYRQRVALKVIRPGLGGGDLLRRFRTERQVLAELEHPHIARLLDGGTTEDGRPYFVMEFIDGQPLHRYCEAHRLGPRERVELLRSVCAAVQYAHGHGVLHRDLKPDNMLVTAEGAPKVTDFGLAKRLESGDGAAGPTASGAVLGTPSYMAPEQAEGKRGAVGPATDVYSLGAILYELLTGRPPFQADTPLETLRQVLSEEPAPPGRLRPQLPRDLNTICLKCLHKEPHQRYATVAALADDLRRFLDGEPIRARPVGPVERLGRWCRRRPGLTAAAACALLALGVAGLVALQAHSRDEKRLGELKAAGERLREEKRQFAEERALLAAMNGDADGAARAIDEAEALGGSPGQTHLLRGQVALQQGHVEAARSHLEQAVAAMPDSVAAHATLALACYHSGQAMRFEKLAPEIDGMVPRTAEDFLYKGQVESLVRPALALQALDEAIRRRDSVVARSARLEARYNYALFNDDVGIAEAALRDAEALKVMLPDNAIVLARSVQAYLAAAGVFAAKGQAERSRAALEQAGRDARALEPFPAVPPALMARFQYYDSVGDDEAALAVSALGPEYRRPVMLYRRGDYSNALEVADRAVARGLGLARVERGFILAELPDGRRRAAGAFAEAAASNEVGYWRLEAPMILLLLGQKAEAMRASLKFRDDPALRAHPWFDDWYHRYLDYHCGLMTEDELLGAAGRCRPKLCEAHFAIGMRHLCDGDRPGARDHFRKSIETRVFIYWDDKWARAFLDRMARDATWPAWIGSRG